MTQAIETWLLAVAATWLLVGMGLGIYMGAMNNHELVAVHTHINLVGFVLHAIFGLAYRVWPELKAHNLLMKTHVFLLMGATPFFVFGIYMTVKMNSESLVVAASLVVFASTLAFCINAWRSLCAG